MRDTTLGPGRRFCIFEILDLNTLARRLGDVGDAVGILILG